MSNVVLNQLTWCVERETRHLGVRGAVDATDAWWTGAFDLLRIAEAAKRCGRSRDGAPWRTLPLEASRCYATRESALLMVWTEGQRLRWMF